MFYLHQVMLIHYDITRLGENPLYKTNTCVIASYIKVLNTMSHTT